MIFASGFGVCCSKELRKRYDLTITSLDWNMKPICPYIQLLIVDESPEAGQTFSIMFNARLFEIVILGIPLSLPRVASTL